MNTKTTVDIAVGLGVSRQTVRNWCQAGMPHTLVTEAGIHFGERRFDLDLCRAWVTDNRKECIKGGKREGAGRPRRVALVEAATAKMAFDRHAGLSEEEKHKALEAEAEKDREDKQMGEYTAMMEGGAAGLSRAMAKMPKHQAERLIRVLEAHSAKLELDKERGSLLDKGECETAWAEALAWLKSGLESLPQRLALKLAPLLGLEEERAGLVRAEAGRIVSELCALMSERPLEELA